MHLPGLSLAGVGAPSNIVLLTTCLFTHAFFFFHMSSSHDADQFSQLAGWQLHSLWSCEKSHGRQHYRTATIATTPTLHYHGLLFQV